MLNPNAPHTMLCVCVCVREWHRYHTNSFIHPCKQFIHQMRLSERVRGRARRAIVKIKPYQNRVDERHAHASAVFCVYFSLTKVNNVTHLPNEYLMWAESSFERNEQVERITTKKKTFECTQLRFSFVHFTQFGLFRLDCCNDFNGIFV